MICHFCHKPITSDQKREHVIRRRWQPGVYYHYFPCYLYYRNDVEPDPPPAVNVPWAWIVIGFILLAVVITLCWLPD